MSAQPLTPTEDGRKIWDRCMADPVFNANLRSFTVRNEKPTTIDAFTCCNCPHVTTCEYVYDLYNLDGDCLALK